MSTKKKQGFASMSVERLQEVSASGGRKKVPKGVAILPPEERTAMARVAAKARWDRVKANRREQIEQ